MKYILLIALLSSMLLCDTTVVCKNKIKANSIYEFSQKEKFSILTVQGELDEGSLYGDIDPANSPISYYDNQSAICGGSANFNRLVSAYCDYNIDSCWDIKLGVSGVSTIVQKEGVYTNNVVVVDSMPCLPYNVSNVTVSYYDYDNNDIGFANFLLTDIEDERKYLLTEEEANRQRESCPSFLQYVDQWEEKLDSQNQALNKNLVSLTSYDFINTNHYVENINNTLKNINNSGNPDNPNTNNDSEYEEIGNNFSINTNINLDSFRTEINNSFESSFNNYSNIFGFDGYGSAPSPITFSLLGKTYSALDITLYNEHLPLIRNSFLAFAYIWGFILTVRTLA